MKALGLVLTSVFILTSSGCATITQSEMQNLTVTTRQGKDQIVEKAKCSLKNDKGAWELESPGVVGVHKSAEDLMVECKKEGLATGYLRAVSRAAGSMFGNIIFGGGIGAIIDHSKGTGYDYPNDLPVQMGGSVTVDQKDKQISQAPCTTSVC